MRPSLRLIALAVALLFSSMSVQNAAADPEPPQAGTMLIECPTAAQVSTALGSAVTAGSDHVQDCYYNVTAGGIVHFGFTASTLSELRSEADTSGAAITDLPALDAEAFAYADGGEWLVRYEVGSLAATISLPVADQASDVDLAQLFRSASDVWPAPTVAPVPFTLTCPNAEAVHDVVGGDPVTLAASGASLCNYTQGTTEISFDLIEGFGSVTEYRTDLTLQFQMSPIPGPIATFDFSGLGPGAFWWTDASPMFVNWQMCDGVVVRVNSWHDEDRLRDLALLMNSQSPCAGGGSPTPTPPSPTVPMTPGLPSTGD